MLSLFEVQLLLVLDLATSGTCKKSQEGSIKNDLLVGYSTFPVP